MIDLERSLVELADRLQIAGGDRLVDDVVRRIAAPVRHRPPARRALVVAFAAAVLLALTVVALPGPRHAIARWLGFDSVRIEPGVTVPTTAPQATISTPASSHSETSGPSTTTTAPQPDLDLGPALSMAEATARTGLADPTPELLGEAQSVHVVQPPEKGQIVLVYPPSELLPQSSVTGVGALVSVIPAQIDEGYFAKMLGSTATVRSVDVDGDRGFWIEGMPHQVFFDAGGQVDSDTLRLATNTLLWQHGDVIYRIEADISSDVALRIASSI